MAANDVILGHMITYLNDKADWQLHKCFFECIVDVVAYLGWPAVCLVEPLLLQVGVTKGYVCLCGSISHHFVTCPCTSIYSLRLDPTRAGPQGS